MLESLWGEEFTPVEKPKTTKKIIDKVNNPKDIKQQSTKSITKKLSLEDKLQYIKDEVYRVLGKQKDNIVIIRNREDLLDYIQKSIDVGIIAIDTETNNTTDTYNCKLMGLCLYSPDLKQAYVPVNHIDVKTGELLPNQVNTIDIHDALQLLNDQRPEYTDSFSLESYGKWYRTNIKPYLRKHITECITHNGKFDYEVLRRTCNIDIPIDWDSLIGAKILNENEKSAGLKEQYIDKIDPDQEKYHIDDLFQDIDYALVDPEVFALYSATDPMMTYKLYEWQKAQFNKLENSDILNLSELVEMPLVTVIANMELTGMEVDTEYAELLSKKFHSRLDSLDIKIFDELKLLEDKINAWRLTDDANKKQLGKTNKEGKSKSEQLTDPINLASPTQLAILFYDILKAPVVDKKQPRATGEDALKAIGEKLQLNLCDLLLKRRELVKLLTTYIDPIPALALNYDDRRVRTKFNQYGAATGRLSSGGSIKTPDGREIGGLNFQNIPSHEKTIRMLFKAKEGYRIIGADFSAQEPRLTAFMSQDPAMIKAYNEGKDLYSVIASMSFDRKYEDCLEFYPEGTKVIVDGEEVIAGHKNVLNVEGKQYRNMAKSVLLGIEYGRGAASVGEQIGKTKEEAQEIIDNFFKSFPAVKKFIDESIKAAHEKGFVSDVAGRHRRLPDAQLPQYEVKYTKNISEGKFNPFIYCDDRVDDAIEKLISTYKEKCEKIRYAKEYETLKSEALSKGIEIHSNTGFIAQAERQAVNCVDKKTEILTLSGWKTCDQINVGDKILSLNPNSQLLEEDKILDIHKYEGTFDAMRIKHNGLDCVSTLNHRWPLYSRSTKKITFETTDYISKYKNYGTKKIIKAADNNFISTCDLSDAELYLLGIWLTDGSVYNIPNKYEMSDRFCCTIVQSTAKNHIIKKIEQNFNLANIQYTKRLNTVKAEKALPSYSFYIQQPTATKWAQIFPDKCLTYDFINSLSQNQAKKLLEGLIDGDGTYERKSKGFTIITSKENQVKVIQYLILRAGYASKADCIDYRGKKCYSDKITNKNGYIEIKNIYYSIRGHARRYADVLNKNCSRETLDFVWCVTTQNSTWIARSSEGYVFITGNSRIQGGAATLTKCALLKIFYDKRLRDIGAYLINTVHDEILIEAPEEYSEQAAQFLSEDMIESAKEYVTNVPMSCDAYNVNAWYVDEYFSIVQKEFKKLLEKGLSPEEAFEVECEERCESTRSQLYEIIGGFLKGKIPEGVDVTYKSLTKVENK